MTKTSKSGGTVGNVLGLIGIYILIYLVCSVMFVGLFHTGLLKNMEVLMYRGIAFIVITGIVAAVVMGVVRKFWGFITVRDIIMLFVIFCCVNTVLFVLVPVTVERSVSVFMLSYMEADYGAFEKRFNEPVETGTIKQNPDGSYSITESGKFIVKAFRTVAEWFDTDRRLVYPNEN